MSYKEFYDLLFDIISMDDVDEFGIKRVSHGVQATQFTGFVNLDLGIEGVQEVLNQLENNEIQVNSLSNPYGYYRVEFDYFYMK